MTFFWIIIVLVIFITAGVEWHFWRLLMGGRWRWWGDTEIEPLRADFQIRGEYLRRGLLVPPTVGVADYVEEPDLYIENLIETERFDEAMNYLFWLIRQARDNNDRGLYRNAAIYRERLARSRAKSEERRRYEIREYLGERRKAMDEARLARKIAEEREKPVEEIFEKKPKSHFLELKLSSFLHRLPLEKKEEGREPDEKESFDDLIDI